MQEVLIQCIMKGVKFCHSLMLKIPLLPPELMHRQKHFRTGWIKSKLISSFFDSILFTLTGADLLERLLKLFESPAADSNTLQSLLKLVRYSWKLSFSMLSCSPGKARPCSRCSECIHSEDKTLTDIYVSKAARLH